MRKFAGLTLVVALAGCGAPVPNASDSGVSNALSVETGDSEAPLSNTTDLPTSNSADVPPDAALSDTSAQGAARVVQAYYALIAKNEYAKARRLWSDDGQASGMSAVDFAASFGKFRDYHATVGTPGDPEGAAGSIYIEVPVEIYGSLKSGEPFRMNGPVRLRRINDVPGSTREERQWHIADIGVRPRP